MTAPRHPGYQRRRALRLAAQATAAEAQRSATAEAQRAEAEWQQMRQQLDDQGLTPLLGPAAQEHLLRDLCGELDASADADGQAHLLRTGLH